MAGQKKMITVIEERIDGHCFSNCSISTMLKLNELLENGSIKKDEIFPDYILSFDDLTTVTLNSMIPFEDALKILSEPNLRKLKQFNLKILSMNYLSILLPTYSKLHKLLPSFQDQFLTIEKPISLSFIR